MSGDEKVTDMIIARFDRFEQAVHSRLDKHADKLGSINEEVTRLEHQIRLQNGRVNKNEQLYGKMFETLQREDGRLDALELINRDKDTVKKHKKKQWSNVRWIIENIDRLIALALAAIALFLGMS